MPFVSNWMDNRLHVVVFPDDEGPASSTTFTLLRRAISSAMAEIFFSCNASDTLIMSFALPLLTAALNAPTVSIPRMLCHR